MGWEVEQASTLGFAALLGPLPIASCGGQGTVGACVQFLLYFLPFAASYWGCSSSFSRIKATGLGQASDLGYFLAGVTLKICCSVSKSGSFRFLGLDFLRKGDSGLWAMTTLTFPK